MRKRAIERDIEIIGEAVKKLPENLRSLHPEIEWKKIAGVRDILAHGYFFIDDILWDIVTNRLTSLKIACTDLLNKA
ncbi:HepT-like ribonuclease domain-containing protein [Leptospira alexanderi]|uniref:HepT-like ribonuclease domain-containing protein n=1 Tax=Leptospira alexanderi TaxID=100053 RepID=UPI001FCF98E0|nr:HepT-like ribonuclease domain-containing protein [Leptospira alexanderi]